MEKRILNLSVIVLLAFCLISGVNAKSVVEADDSLKVSGNYNSSKFLFGNDVNNTSSIDGIALIAGNAVTTSGEVNYGLYAGNSLYIGDAVSKDLFIAGNTVTISSDALLGRDVYIAGSTVKIGADIGRNLRVGAETVDLSGITINGNAYISANEITLDENTVITGKLLYTSDATITGLNVAQIGSVEEKASIEYSTDKSTGDKIYDIIVSIIAAYIVMIVLIKLIPSLKTKLDNVKVDGSYALKLFGIGLILLIVVPIVSIIALFTGILLPLALITLCVYCIAIYLSTLFVSYIIGNKIMDKLNKNNSEYLTLLMGILLVKIVSLIPYIGFLISAIILFVGLGLIYDLIRNKTA